MSGKDKYKKKIYMNEKLKESLINKQYGVFKNSAVQICSWTKKAIRGKGVCYKQKFYGISCLQCMQFSPIIFCQENCIHCWRPKELLNVKGIYEAIENKKIKFADPEEIIEKLIIERKKLLIGFKGNKKVNKRIVENALNPVHYAISLVGDPMLYPKLPELINLLKNKYKAKSIFLVTNAQEPDAMKKLIEQGALPTQLYISVTATNEKKYKELKRSYYKDAWKKFIKFLKIASKANCRRVIRYTLIKGINNKETDANELLNLIKIYNPHFIEVKAYMHLGYSLLRLKRENMPHFKDVISFSNKLEKISGYKKINSDSSSRIVLLGR